MSKKSSKKSLLSAARKAIKGLRTESGQRLALARLFKRHGYTKKPTVSQGYAGHGGTEIRFYHYEGLPGGALVLVTARKHKAQVYSLAELRKMRAPKGFAIAAVPARAEVKKALSAEYGKVLKTKAAPKKKAARRGRAPARPAVQAPPISRIAGRGGIKGARMRLNPGRGRKNPRKNPFDIALAPRPALSARPAAAREPLKRPRPIPPGGFPSTRPNPGGQHPLFSRMGPPARRASVRAPARLMKPGRANERPLVPIRMNPPRQNHHLPVGTRVRSRRGHGRIARMLANDQYVVRYPQGAFIERGSDLKQNPAVWQVRWAVFGDPFGHWNRREFATEATAVAFARTLVARHGRSSSEVRVEHGSRLVYNETSL